MNERRAPDWLTQWEYAHRGLHSAGVPENSLAAAEAAIAAGMGVECDIQRSRDDHPMVFHDWDLARLTGAAGATGRRSAIEIEQLFLNDTEHRPFRLAALLDRIAGRVPLLIEIKSRPRYSIAASCAAVRHLLGEYAGPAAVMSFDPRVARWFRRYAPKVCAGLVMREDERGDTQSPWRRTLALRIAQPDFLAYHIDALPSRWVAGLRAEGLPVLTWTVNSPETRARARAHADALIAEGAGLA
ncbi:glycerophosphodiester phosphodiesterase family protein [Erythrobacter sp. R86502]|uniref:glycerophosphodiester phosphodiesterase family protein n=1 Tax=Erythrobacter sp. R86502 TaxID=3093846 RepID=UPI0036D32FFE